MAYLDELDDDEIADLADDRPGTLGEMRERDRLREEVERRRREAAPSTPEPEEPAPAPYTPPEPPDVSDEMEGLDLSVLDSLEENARGAGTNTPRMDFSGEDPDALLADAHPEPDADEAGGPPDADADDLGTLGTAMDYSPTEAGRMALDDSPGGMDEPYPPDPNGGPVSMDPSTLIMPLNNPAVRATIDPYVLPAPRREALLAERGNAAALAAEAGDLPDDLPELDAEHAEPDADEMGGPSDMDADDGPYASDPAARGGVDSRAMDADAAVPPIEQPFDRNAGSEDVDMGGWSRRPGDPEPASTMSLGDFPDVGTPDTAAPAMSMGDFPDDLLDTTEGAYGLADPSGPMEERSADLPASTSKSTPYDRPLPVDDFTGADWSDAVRGGIGGLLQALSGRGVTPVRSERDAMQARIDARNEAKGRATATATEAATDRDELRARMEESAATREARSATSAETAEERHRHNMEMERLAGRRADTGDMRAETAESEAVSRNAARGSRTAREDAMRDPASEESRRARERLAGEIELLPASIRDTARAHLAREDWSAAEVEEAESNIPGFGRSYLSRGAGGTPSAGGRAGISDEALNAELLRLGIDEASIAVATRRQREDMLDERTGGTAADAAGSLVPGVPMDTVRVDLGTVEARNIRDSVSLLRNGISSLDAIDALEREYGATALVTPEMWGELEAHTSRLLSVVADVRDIGVIQIGEMAGVRSALPDPSSVIGTSLGRYAGSMRGWRDVIDEDVATTIGVVTDENPEAIDAALGWLHSPPRHYGGERASRGGITVRDPESGESHHVDPGELSEDEIAALTEAGYEVER